MELVLILRRLRRVVNVNIYLEPSVTVSGKQYACSEEAYHAQKPEPFGEAVWDERKVDVMLEAVSSKFRAVGAR